MDRGRFDTLARALGAGASRRTILETAGGSALGAFGVAALLGADDAEAKAGGNKSKCKKQVSRCREGLAELCATLFPEPGGNFGAEECVEAFGPCCRALGGCNAAQAFACAVAKVEELRQEM
jgi:hypothetical protein